MGKWGNIQNSGVCQTLGYAEPETYSEPRVIQKPGIFKTGGILRNLSSVYDGALIFAISALHVP